MSDKKPKEQKRFETLDKSVIELIQKHESLNGELHPRPVNYLELEEYVKSWEFTIDARCGEEEEYKDEFACHDMKIYLDQLKNPNTRDK